jgi:tetratricopeptide (TPR) repeat protein
VKPEIAWSRAQQAVTLLGQPGSIAAVADEAARNAAYLTLAEVCFTLGFRNTKLPAELGRPDLFVEAHKAALMADRPGLAAIIESIGKVQRASFEGSLHALVSFAQVLPAHKDQIEPWILVELGAKTTFWMEELESALNNGHNAALLIRLLPPFYEALQVPDRTARIDLLKQRAIQLLIKEKQFAAALGALRASHERQPKLEAICLEGLGDFRAAAECHLAAGNRKEALNCYRSIPDFEAALKLVREIGDHPAAESLEWISKLQQLIAERPDKFTKVVTAAEKKLLQDVLERGLGVSRRKPAERKATVKKAPVARKRAAKKKEKEYF